MKDNLKRFLRYLFQMWSIFNSIQNKFELMNCPTGGINCKNILPENELPRSSAPRYQKIVSC